jgi:hypothetical protein
MKNDHGAEAIVYFRDAQGGSSGSMGSNDFGHIFVEVINRESGRSDYYDFWMGPRGQGILNDQLTDERREAHWQTHLEISPQAADRMLQEIESHRLESTQYHPSGIDEIFDAKNTCVSGTMAVLEAGGIHVTDAITPAGLWEGLLDYFHLEPVGISEPTPTHEHPNYSTPDGHVQHVPAPADPNFSHADGQISSQPDHNFDTSTNDHHSAFDHRSFDDDDIP